MLSAYRQPDGKCNGTRYHYQPKEYVDFDLTPDEVAAALTSIGLETGSVEEVQTIKGGLEGLVIGEVLTCEAHPRP